MIYAMFFCVVGLLCGGLGIQVLVSGWLLGGVGLGWVGLGFWVVGLGYAGLGAGVFGKRADGGRSLWARLLLAPYLILVWLLWRSPLPFSNRHSAYQEIVPNLWLGRRLMVSELPEFITLVVDLTCEYTRHRQWCDRAYICVPTLDDSVPDRQAFQQAIAQVVEWPGPVYVHCAAGVGRSAMFVAGILLRKGLAKNPEAAEAMVRAKRSVVKLKPIQRRFLDDNGYVHDEI